MKTINELQLKRLDSDYKSVKLTTSKQVYDYVKQFYYDDIDIYESMFLLLLNTNMKTIGYAKISQGGIKGTVVDVKIIAKYVIDSLASNAIICHNHPSGNLTPSQCDLEITKKIKQILELMNSELQDSLIIINNNYFSMKDEGLL